MIIIDGAIGEGGGQILRTALGLSLVTGKFFCIENIRAGRKKPGLLRQHLTAVNAAKAVGDAEVIGGQLGSQELTFKPTQVSGGEYHFSVGTAGSATLVLQSILPALITAAGPSHLVLEGGTHNPYAPPFDFLQKAFLPVLEQMGARVDVTLERFGFYPAGGGKFAVDIKPVKKLKKLDLLEKGKTQNIRAKAIVANLSRNIAERELKLIQHKLSGVEGNLEVVEVRNSIGPGNIIAVEIESEHAFELFTGFGERGKPAEVVSTEAVDMVKQYLAANVPVGRYLADQLLIPFALAGGGSFKTMPLSRHTKTNISIIEKFLDVKIAVDEVQEKEFVVSVNIA